MDQPYGYYAAPSPGAVAGGVTAAATESGLSGSKEFNWTSILIAVTVGSLTAVLTQLTLEHVEEKKKLGKKPKHRALIFAETK
jgi:hypothetical protein